MPVRAPDFESGEQRFDSSSPSRHGHGVSHPAAGRMVSVTAVNGEDEGFESPSPAARAGVAQWIERQCRCQTLIRCSLGDRLVVGRLALNQATGVRVPVSQPLTVTVTVKEVMSSRFVERVGQGYVRPIAS